MMKACAHFFVGNLHFFGDKRPTRRARARMQSSSEMCSAYTLVRRPPSTRTERVRANGVLFRANKSCRLGCIESEMDGGHTHTFIIRDYIGFGSRAPNLAAQRCRGVSNIRSRRIECGVLHPKLHPAELRASADAATRSQPAKHTNLMCTRPHVAPSDFCWPATDSRVRAIIPDGEHTS